MSIQMIEKWKFVDATPTQRFVGWILAEAHNGQTGQCNPSILRIAQLTGYSARAVGLAIQGLEEAGHLTVHRRTGSNSFYTLHPRTTFATEPPSLPNDVRPTPERRSPEPEVSGRLNRNEPAAGALEADFSENGNPRMIDRIISEYPVNGNEMDARRALALLASQGADLPAILEKVKVHARCIAKLPEHRRQFCPRMHTYFEGHQFNGSPNGAPWVYTEEPPPKSRPAFDVQRGKC